MNAHKKKQKFTREQLVFMVDIIITSAWDRIDAFLPDVANESNLKDYNARKDQIGEMIHGAVSVVGSALPILYAQLTDDGMGIGDFNIFEQFEQEVDRFIADKINPKLNRPGFNLVHPDGQPLALRFVAEYFDEYLEEPKPSLHQGFASALDRVFGDDDEG